MRRNIMVLRMVKKNRYLLGGNFDLSMSMATTFMINTHMGLSNMSCSFLTKLMALKHWHSKRLRSGYALRNSRDTFCWNFFMSNNWKTTQKYRENMVFLSDRMRVFRHRKARTRRYLILTKTIVSSVVLLPCRLWQNGSDRISCKYRARET